MKEYTVKVLVATHKKYQMPDDEMYLPLHVGAEGKTDDSGKELDFGYVKDNTGDNISYLNPFFCELTGLYWAWKNLDSDYIGLVHYRRYFTMKRKILEKNHLVPYLGKAKIFVPKKRWYVIETLKSHYEHTHCSEHIDITRAIVLEKYPDYENVFDRALDRRWGYMFNMMIAQKDLIDDYCDWLFDVLFEVFKKIDRKNYSTFESRYIGRISELLFNVWLEKAIENKKIKKSEIMELNLDVDENLFLKIPAFLKAKFFGKKYTGSF